MAHDIPLGKLAGEDASRDAVHIAIAPVVAGTDLAPGTRVCILAHDGRAYPNETPHSIGIVDPFLTQIVKKGECFYLCLFPGTITSLRHHWQHPAFEDEEEPEPSPPINWKYINDGSSEMVAALGANLTPNGPPWRTETVIGLCRQMLESNDFSALPVLADALEEAGYMNAEFLEQSRRQMFKSFKDRAFVGSIMSDDFSTSVMVIQGVAERISKTFEEMIEASKEFTKSSFQSSDETWDYQYITDEEWLAYWKHYEIFMGCPLPSRMDRTESPYTCPC